MKLFDDFEAVKFPQENEILITRRGYLYYICELEDKFWRKHRNAGNDRITVRNYQEVSKEEIVDAMGGIFPVRESDFSRLCVPSRLRMGDLMEILSDDYPQYMSDNAIYHIVYRLIDSSDIMHVSYDRLRKLFDNALILQHDYRQVTDTIRSPHIQSKGIRTDLSGCSV